MNVFYSITELRQAASALHGFGYIVKPQHVGGHGDALTLVPEEPAERTFENTYFVTATDTGCYVHTPAPAWGQYDEVTMKRFAQALYGSTIEAAKEALPAAAQSRLRKAIALVLAGAVSEAGNGFDVESQSTDDTYHVNGRCDCPDATFNAPTFAGRPTCKHQLAVWLAQKVDLQQKLQKHHRDTAPLHIPDTSGLFKSEPRRRAREAVL